VLDSEQFIMAVFRFWAKLDAFGLARVLRGPKELIMILRLALGAIEPPNS
jgi:hypothetical protein